MIHRVRMEGFLAQVEPGTRFEIESSPVELDIWLTKHYSMRKRRQKSCSWSLTTLKKMTLFQHHHPTPSPVTKFEDPRSRGCSNVCFCCNPLQRQQAN